MSQLSSADAADKRNLESALAYAAKGWKVFPAPPGSKKSYKSEKHSGGRKWGMTSDADEIRADMRRQDRNDGDVGLRPQLARQSD